MNAVHNGMKQEAASNGRDLAAAIQRLAMEPMNDIHAGGRREEVIAGGEITDAAKKYIFDTMQQIDAGRRYPSACVPRYSAERRS
jgi:hypothetical protein